MILVLALSVLQVTTSTCRHISESSSESSEYSEPRDISDLFSLLENPDTHDNSKHVLHLSLNSDEKRKRWDDRKKHIVEIAPLRPKKKNREGSKTPLAIILASNIKKKYGSGKRNRNKHGEVHNAGNTALQNPKYLSHTDINQDLYQNHYSKSLNKHLNDKPSDDVITYTTTLNDYKNRENNGSGMYTDSNHVDPLNSYIGNTPHKYESNMHYIQSHGRRFDSNEYPKRNNIYFKVSDYDFVGSSEESSHQESNNATEIYPESPNNTDAVPKEKTNNEGNADIHENNNDTDTSESGSDSGVLDSSASKSDSENSEKDGSEESVETSELIPESGRSGNEKSSSESAETEDVNNSTYYLSRYSAESNSSESIEYADGISGQANSQFTSVESLSKELVIAEIKRDNNSSAVLSSNGTETNEASQTENFAKKMNEENNTYSAESVISSTVAVEKYEIPFANNEVHYSGRWEIDSDNTKFYICESCSSKPDHEQEFHKSYSLSFVFNK